MSSSILLINPILSKTDFEPPLGLLYISGACRAGGHKTKVVDLSFVRDLDYFKNYILPEIFDFDAVGIYSMSSMIDNVLEIACMVKHKKADIKIILGGPHPTLFPEEVLSSKCVDFVVMGEGERTIVELLDNMSNESYYPSIEGMGFRDEEGRIIINKRRELIDNLDILHFPDRTELDTLEGYINLAGIKVLFGRRALNIIASRGCSFDCAFCQPALRKIHGPNARYRSVRNVIAEMEYIKKKWKIDAVWFEDDTITFKKDWIVEFCDSIMRNKIKIGWSCNSRIDTVDEGLLKIMKKANCRQIRYGVESGSQKVLDGDFKKGTKIDRVKDIFDMTRKIGIKTYSYVMIGGRFETLDSINETRRFLKDISPNHIQLAITTPLPETRLKQEMESDKDIKIKTNSYKDIRLFEKCNFDTGYLKAYEIESIYRGMFNEFHFFKLRELINKNIFSWIKRNLDFMIILIKIKQDNKLLFTLSIFMRYLILALRLAIFRFLFMKKLDRILFKERLSFPPL